MRDSEREAEAEAGSPWEPDVGLDPRTPGSQPEPKADAQPLNHSGAPEYISFLTAFCVPGTDPGAGNTAFVELTL